VSLKRLPKDFLILQEEWYLKLAQSGFKDIEDRKGNLKQYDRRTIAFDNRESIYEFFVALDHYLTDHQDIPEPDKSILSLYSDGIFIIEICKQLGLKLSLVNKVISKYKEIVTQLQRIEFFP
jgi:hypothetical protein